MYFIPAVIPNCECETNISAKAHNLSAVSNIRGANYFLIGNMSHGFPTNFKLFHHFCKSDILKMKLISMPVGYKFEVISCIDLS